MFRLIFAFLKCWTEKVNTKKVTNLSPRFSGPEFVQLDLHMVGSQYCSTHFANAFYCAYILCSVICNTLLNYLCARILSLFDVFFRPHINSLRQSW